jgi:hypothetical protein
MGLNGFVCAGNVFVCAGIFLSEPGFGGIILINGINSQYILPL